jgi:hypothetical protein
VIKGKSLLCIPYSSSLSSRRETSATVIHTTLTHTHTHTHTHTPWAPVRVLCSAALAMLWQKHRNLDLLFPHPCALPRPHLRPRSIRPPRKQLDPRPSPRPCDDTLSRLLTFTCMLSGLPLPTAFLPPMLHWWVVCVCVCVCVCVVVGVYQSVCLCWCICSLYCTLLANTHSLY